jgi:flagellar hook assembly protein FlgD
MTSFDYAIPNFTDIKISIYDVSGTEIRSWSYQNRYPDNYTLVWDGTNMSGQTVPSGIYIYRIAANHYNVSKKMVLLK